MSNQNNADGAATKALLCEISNALLEASPKQIESYLRKTGLADRANENLRRLRRAMAIDYGTSIGVSIEYDVAALVGVDEVDPAICRLHLRFALAADPRLEKTLGVTLRSLDNMPDDMVTGIFQRLRDLKLLTPQGNSPSPKE